MVARYFSFMMASFSVLPRKGMLRVLFVSCSICISRLKGEGEGYITHTHTHTHTHIVEKDNKKLT